MYIFFSNDWLNLLGENIFDRHLMVYLNFDVELVLKQNLKISMALSVSKNILSSAPWSYIFLSRNKLWKMKAWKAVPFKYPPILTFLYWKLLLNKSFSENSQKNIKWNESLKTYSFWNPKESKVKNEFVLIGFSPLLHNHAILKFPIFFQVLIYLKNHFETKNIKAKII